MGLVDVEESLENKSVMPLSVGNGFTNCIATTQIGKDTASVMTRKIKPHETCFTVIYILSAKMYKIGLIRQPLLYLFHI